MNYVMNHDLTADSGPPPVAPSRLQRRNYSKDIVAAKDHLLGERCEAKHVLDITVPPTDPPPFKTKPERRAVTQLVKASLLASDAKERMMSADFYNPGHGYKFKFKDDNKGEDMKKAFGALGGTYDDAFGPPPPIPKK